MDIDLERKFLTFTWFFINRGWKECWISVENAVEQVFDGITVKSPMTFEKMQEKIQEIRNLVELVDTNNKKSLINFNNLLMPQDLEGELLVLREGGGFFMDSEKSGGGEIDEGLRLLLDETRDILDCEDFRSIATKCLDSTFQIFLKSLIPIFHKTSPPLHTINNQDIMRENKEIINRGEEDVGGKKNSPLVAVLPTITKSVHYIVNGIPNEYSMAVTQTPELLALSAIIYTSWKS